MELENIEWGQYLSVDLGECNPFKIRDKASIIEFIESLIKEIGMEQFGEVQAERFALDNPEVAGYSAMCFLTTSHVSAHFAEKSNSIFLDIFTCSKLDVEKTVRFCIEFFNAGRYDTFFRPRYIPNIHNSITVNHPMEK